MKLILKRQVKSYSRGLTFEPNVEYPAVKADGFYFAIQAGQQVRMARTNILHTIDEKNDEVTVDEVPDGAKLNSQTTTQNNTNMAKKKSTTKTKDVAPTGEQAAAVSSEPTHELVGQQVQFSKKGSEELLTGKVIKVFKGTDDKDYVRIRLQDYTTCLKQIGAVKPV